MQPATKRLLFVCTGNICRSPMAEYLLREKLGGRRDWTVESAGVSAVAGIPASVEAVQALRACGIDLRRHRSQPLRRECIDAATLVVVMTRSHRDQLLALFPDALEKLYLLRAFDPKAADPDLHDPIGMPLRVYRETCDAIRAALPGLVQYMETFHQAGGES